MAFFGPLRKMAQNFIKLDVNAIINEILSDKSFQEFIISLNTDKQLFEEGINSLDVSLESIGGAYSPFTVLIKKEKGQPTDRVTLKDTGEFYDSFRITLNPTDFELDADPNKDDTNLFKEWGEDIVGLTDENLQLVIDVFREKLAPLILEKTLEGV